MKHFEPNKKVKKPDASMLSIKTGSISNAIRHPKKPKDLMEQLLANDVFQTLVPNMKKFLESASPKKIIELFAIGRVLVLNSIQTNDTLSFFEKSNSNTRVIDIQTEQEKYPAIRKVLPAFKKDDITYAAFELTNYHRSNWRLQLQKKS